MAYFSDIRYQPSWKDPFEGSSSKRSGSPMLPRPENLPENLWVVLGPKVHLENSILLKDEVKDWIKQNRIKCRSEYVIIDRKLTHVFVFKKVKDAVLFKLTWG